MEAEAGAEGWAMVFTAGVCGGAVLCCMWWALREVADVRVNVLLLAVAMLGLVGMGFAYARSVDGINDETFSRLAEAIASDAATASTRVAALSQILDAERAFTRDVLSVIAIVGAGINVLALAIGALLRSGNDLSKPHDKALELLAGDADRVAELKAAAKAARTEVDKLKEKR